MLAVDFSEVGEVFEEGWGLYDVEGGKLGEGFLTFRGSLFMFGGEGADSLFERLNSKQFALKTVVLIHMSVKYL